MSDLADSFHADKQVSLIVEIDFNGHIRRFADQDVTIYNGTDYHRFDGIIINAFDVSSNYDLRNMTYAASSISIQVINKDRFQDLERNMNMEMGIGCIYAWSPGASWTDIVRDGLLFKGVFHIEEYDRFTMTFTLTDLGDIRWSVIPEVTINTDTWPDAHSGVLEQAEPLIYGYWASGIPLKYVSTVSFKYLVAGGVSKSLDAEYTAGTRTVYDKDGAGVGAGDYAFYPGATDGEGNICSYFDFSADASANDPMTCEIEGVYDGDGTITGTADGLIEHPADIVLHLIKNHTTFEPSEISMQTIRTMRSLMPYLKFASIVNSQVSSRDVVSRILRQCSAGAGMFGGRIGVMALVTDGPEVASLRWDHHIIGDRVKITRTPIDDVVNRVRAKYGLDPSNGKYASEILTDHNNNRTCKLSYFRYGPMPEYSFNLPDVQYEATATYCVNRLIELKAYRHDIAEFEVPYWDGIDVKEGDAALLTIPDGASSDGEGWQDEKCVLIQRTFKKNTILQKWWKVAV